MCAIIKGSTPKKHAPCSCLTLHWCQKWDLINHLQWGGARSKSCIPVSPAVSPPMDPALPTRDQTLLPLPWEPGSAAHPGWTEEVATQGALGRHCCLAGNHHRGSGSTSEKSDEATPATMEKACSRPSSSKSS